MGEVKVFRSHWTSQKMKEFRKEFSLSQMNLALMLGTPQQRISEWEVGIHGMKRAYSQLMDLLQEKLIPIRRGAGKDKEKYHGLVLKVFGVDISGKGPLDGN